MPFVILNSSFVIASPAQMESVRALIPRFESKIQRVLDRVWGTV